MKRIRLTNYKMDALLDDEDFAEVSRHNWYLSKQGYAARSVWLPDRKTNGTVYMHRHVLGTADGFDTDHIDLNKLNNQKANLRQVSRSENMANLSARGGLSQYKGVSRLNRPNLKKPWVAYIKVDYKNKHLGYFVSEKEAAEAYNAKALEIYGDSSRLNQL